MMNKNTSLTGIATLALVFGLTACGEEEDAGNGGNGGTNGTEEMEIITTVNIALTAMGASINGSWQDLDGDGANPPTITNPTPLTAGTTYTMAITILNETEMPPEDITEEIREEAEEHQFFFPTSGSLVTVTPTDLESTYTMNMVGADLPVGLTSQVSAPMAGSGDLRIVLKHLPPVSGQPQKTGTNTINDGESDFDITFAITVQ